MRTLTVHHMMLECTERFDLPLTIVPREYLQTFSQLLVGREA